MGGSVISDPASAGIRFAGDPADRTPSPTRASQQILAAGSARCFGRSDSGGVSDKTLEIPMAILLRRIPRELIRAPDANEGKTASPLFPLAISQEGERGPLSQGRGDDWQVNCRRHEDAETKE